MAEQEAPLEGVVSNRAEVSGGVEVVQEENVAVSDGNREGCADSAEEFEYECESVQMLDKLIQQHKSVYSDDTLSKHFHGDVLSVASKCWEQVNQRIHNALEAKFSSVLDELTVKERLTHLDRLWDESDPNESAWRPSGEPGADVEEAAGVVMRQQVTPRFQEASHKVHLISVELQKVLTDRQNYLKALESDIQTQMEELGVFVGTLSHSTL